MKRSLAGVALCLVAGCTVNPASRSNAESHAPVSLYGYAASTAPVRLRARVLAASPPTWAPVGSAAVESTPSFTNPVPLYKWSTSQPFAAEYWAPQGLSVYGLPLNGLAQAPGRIELMAANGGSAFKTFSSAGQWCLGSKIGQGQTVVAAGQSCTDGDTTVLHDNDGVGNGPETAKWTKLQSQFETVAGKSIYVELGSYPVQGGTVYGLRCQPGDATTSKKLYKTMILNHGGFELNDLTLNECGSAAANGWVVAASAFRGAKVDLHLNVPFLHEHVAFAEPPVGLCLGEVVDTLRLLELVRELPYVDKDAILMWGHSHGGCVTLRAIEQGALVKAAVTFSAPTDLYAWQEYCAPGTACDTWCREPPDTTSCTVRLGVQIAAGVIELGWPADPVATPALRLAFDWRSPTFFADDLRVRSNPVSHTDDVTGQGGEMPVLLIASEGDTLIHPSQACKLATAAWGSSATFVHVGTTDKGTQGPEDCAGTPQSWLHRSSLGAIPWGPRMVLVFEKGDHNAILKGGAAWSAFDQFVQKLGFPSPGPTPI